MLDAIDRAILTALQADGRLSNAELAERVGLSPAPCWRRVKALERAGVIRGYTALIDPAAVGLGESVFAQLSLDSHAKLDYAAFEASVAEIPEIQEAYLIAGDADVMIRVAVRNAGDYERFQRTKLSRIPGISRVRSIYALKRFKHTNALPVAADEDET